MRMRNRFAFAILLSAASFAAPLIAPAQQATGADDSLPQVENLDVHATIAEGDEATPSQVRTYQIKFISGRTIYIDGGSNSGLRVGMRLDVYRGAVPASTDGAGGVESLAVLHVIGIASTSALTEVTAGDSDVQIGDSAVLDAHDAAVAEQNLAAPPPAKAIVVTPEEENQPAQAATSVASNAM